MSFSVRLQKLECELSERRATRGAIMLEQDGVWVVTLNRKQYCFDAQDDALAFCTGRGVSFLVNLGKVRWSP
jgi:hypothetical protein